MFKDRAITVTMDKKTSDPGSTTTSDPKDFEHKTEYVLEKLETIGTKLFVGLCVYVVMDTCRQVSVARATNRIR